MSALTKALLVGLAVLALALGVQTWRVSAAQHDTVEAAVAPAKAAAAAAKHEEQRSAATLDARIDTVTRWLTRTVHDTVPASVLHPVTRQDSVAAVAELPKAEARYQSCRAELLPLKDDCVAYRLRAQARFAGDSIHIAALEDVLLSRPPRRHWTLGVTAGYGALLTGRTITTGPSLTAGLTWSPF